MINFLSVAYEADENGYRVTKMDVEVSKKILQIFVILIGKRLYFGVRQDFFLVQCKFLELAKGHTSGELEKFLSYSYIKGRKCCSIFSKMEQSIVF